MVLRAMRLRIPLRNWLDEEISMDPGLERLALSNMDWKKLKYLIILLRPFAEYTSLIGVGRKRGHNKIRIVAQQRVA